MLHLITQEQAASICGYGIIQDVFFGQVYSQKACRIKDTDIVFAPFKGEFFGFAGTGLYYVHGFQYLQFLQFDEPLPQNDLMFAYDDEADVCYDEDKVGAVVRHKGELYSVWKTKGHIYKVNPFNKSLKSAFFCASPQAEVYGAHLNYEHAVDFNLSELKQCGYIIPNFDREMTWAFVKIDNVYYPVEFDYQFETNENDCEIYNEVRGEEYYINVNGDKIVADADNNFIVNGNAYQAELIHNVFYNKDLDKYLLFSDSWQCLNDNSGEYADISKFYHSCATDYCFTNELRINFEIGADATAEFTIPRNEKQPIVGEEVEFSDDEGNLLFRGIVENVNCDRSVIAKINIEDRKKDLADYLLENLSKYYPLPSRQMYNPDNEEKINILNKYLEGCLDDLALTPTGNIEVVATDYILEYIDISQYKKAACINDLCFNQRRMLGEVLVEYDIEFCQLFKYETPVKWELSYKDELVCAMAINGRSPNIQEVKSALNGVNWIFNKLKFDGVPKQGWYDCGGLPTFWSTTPSEKYENDSDEFDVNDNEWYTVKFTANAVRRWTRNATLHYRWSLFRDTASYPTTATIQETSDFTQGANDAQKHLISEWEDKEKRIIDTSIFELNDNHDVQTVTATPNSEDINKDIDYLGRCAYRQFIKDNLQDYAVLEFPYLPNVKIGLGIESGHGFGSDYVIIGYTHILRASGRNTTQLKIVRQLNGISNEYHDLLPIINNLLAYDTQIHEYETPKFEDAIIPAGVEIIEDEADRENDTDFNIGKCNGWVRRETGYKLGGVAIKRPYAFCCKMPDIPHQFTDEKEYFVRFGE